MNRQRVGLLDRIRQSGRLLGAEGPRAVVERVRWRVSDLARPGGGARLPVTMEDIRGAAEAARDGWELPGPAPHRSSEPLAVGWVCTPPGPGSGGHTTMFRMIAALEAGGHHCVVYLRDRHGWSLEQHRRTIREWWPWVRAEVRDFEGGVADSHVLFATGWDLAYALLRTKALGVRAYLVQDFEPAFAPMGSEYLLAEATYRFGFHGVTAGRWLSELLSSRYGMVAEPFDFGCDLDAYRWDPELEPHDRVGVCYYCRPTTPRRAHELAMMALDLFAGRHPEVDIHVYGEPIEPPTFRAIQHGLLPPERLDRLYNTCVAGLVLSATNVSLVPFEMLAAGCIPVVNDADQNRLVLANEHVYYAPATPFDLADALSALVERSPEERRAGAAEAAASVQGTSWAAAGAQFTTIVERMVHEHTGRHGATPATGPTHAS